MKNKQLGKILLCTTLALATPFTLVACGNKTNNQKPNQQEEQQVVTPTTITMNYAEPITWPYVLANSTKTAYATDNALRADLTNFVTSEWGEETNLARAQKIAMSNLINRYIVDSDDASGGQVNETKSTKYVFSVPTSAIENYNSAHAVTVNAGESDQETLTGLRAYYEEFYQAYDQKFARQDSGWTAIEGNDAGAYWKTTLTEDIFVGFEYDSTAQTITVYEFSFSGGAIEDAWQTIGNEMPAETQRVLQSMQQNA